MHNVNALVFGDVYLKHCDSNASAPRTPKSLMLNKNKMMLNHKNSTSLEFVNVVQ